LMLSHRSPIVLHFGTVAGGVFTTGRKAKGSDHAPTRSSRLLMTSPESLSDHKVQGYLAAREVVTLAAIGPDGGPWATPMWFLPTPDAIFMISVDGLPKVKSLRRDPRVAVVAETTAPDGAIQGVTVRGRVEFLQDSAERRRLVQQFLDKYH